MRNPKPGDSPPRRTGMAVPLTPDQRRTLVAMIRRHPKMSNDWIASTFSKQTGRSLSPPGVRYARENIDTYGDPKQSRNWLTEDERTILRDVIRDSAPDYCATEIAREVSSLIGRDYDRSSARYALRKMGIKGPGRGWHPKGVKAVSIAGRIAKASAEKREEQP